MSILPWQLDYIRSLLYRPRIPLYVIIRCVYLEVDPVATSPNPHEFFMQTPWAIQLPDSLLLLIQWSLNSSVSVAKAKTNNSGSKYQRLAPGIPCTKCNYRSPDVKYLSKNSSIV